MPGGPNRGRTGATRLATTARHAWRDEGQRRSPTEQPQRATSTEIRRQPAVSLDFAGNQCACAAARPTGVLPQRRTNDL